MAVALTTQSTVGILLESTRGTTPASGAFDAIPFLDGASFDVQKQPAIIAVNDGSRVKSTIVGGSYSVRIRFPFAVNNETGSRLLYRTALHSADWASGVIEAGNNASYFFSLILKQELGATDDYLIYTGCEVAQMTLSGPLNGACTGTVDIVGMAATTPATALPGTTTLGTLAGKNPFSTGLTGSTLSWGSTLDGAAEFSLTINNESDPKQSWGGTGAHHIVSGNAIVNGTFGAYYTGSAIQADIIAETVRALTVTLKCSEGGSEDTMTISMPSSKLTNAPINDNAKSWLQNAAYFAQYNAGIGTNLAITID